MSKSKGITKRPAQTQTGPLRAFAGKGAPRLVGQGESDGVGNAGATVDRHVQAEREELGDAAKDHDNGNHQVDDAAATKGDMLAL